LNGFVRLQINELHHEEANNNNAKRLCVRPIWLQAPLSSYHSALNGNISATDAAAITFW
jgi:hypothetical protein